MGLQAGTWDHVGVKRFGATARIYYFDTKVFGDILVSTNKSIHERRGFLAGSGLAIAGAGFLAGNYLSSRERLPLGVDKVELAEMQLPPPTDPDEALERLITGNSFFVQGYHDVGDRRRSLAHRMTLVGNQTPFALILGCSDSRVAPELLFSTGLGDLFVVRVIGNVVDPQFSSVIGSIEYGVHELKIPLVMVLGHQQCGAVKAAIRVVQENIELPSAIDVVADSIRPVVIEASKNAGELVSNSVVANVKTGVERLRTSLPLAAEPLASGRLKIVGATYDLKTGKATLVES